MNNQTWNPRIDVVVLSIISVIMLSRYHQPFPLDDAGFFLRYANHIASGYGYHWNTGESAPVGASAPLWPPIVAIVQFILGIQTTNAATILAITLLALTYYLVFDICALLWNTVGAVISFLFLASSPLIMGYAMGGMETPLTVLLIALAINVIVKHRDNTTYICILGALLVIHKIDLIPWALALFAATSFNPFRREALRGLSIFALVLLLFAVCMYSSTGSIIPISIVRKFSDSAGLNSSEVLVLPRMWFAKTAIFSGGRLPITILFLLSLPALFLYQRPLFYFSVIGILGQSIAYTLFPPTEPFGWYAVPVIFVISVMAPAFCGAIFSIWWKGIFLSVSIALMIYVFTASEPTRLWFLANSSNTEADRSRAGIWVANHTPKSFRVATGWGNPAFFSMRKVYDFSGLNMSAPSDFDYIVKTYRPEILILCFWNSEYSPGDAPAPSGYKFAKGFASALESKQDNFYTSIYVRKDLKNQLSPRTFEETL